MVSYLLIPYTILHATLQWFFGRFWTIFKVQIWRPHVLAGLVALAVAVPIAAGAYFLDGMATTLTVPRIAGGLARPRSRRRSRRPGLGQAKPVIIHTAKATNSPGHVSDITVKAVHDGTNVYFQFQWDDPDVSFKRYPLVKTEGGWKVLADGVRGGRRERLLRGQAVDVRHRREERQLRLDVPPRRRPRRAKSEKHGLHYTTGGEYGDVWHWKSVRTTPWASSPASLATWTISTSGRMPRRPSRANGIPAATTADPDKGGGYAYNFVKVDPKKHSQDTYVVPKFLPPHNDAVHTNAVASAPMSTARRGGSRKRRSSPLHEGGRHLPGRLPHPEHRDQSLHGRPRRRAGKGVWKDGPGRWRRGAPSTPAASTTSPSCRAKPLYITVAMYNRTQTRHSEHIKPVRVMLQP